MCFQKISQLQQVQNAKFIFNNSIIVSRACSTGSSEGRGRLRNVQRFMTAPLSAALDVKVERDLEVVFEG